ENLDSESGYIDDIIGLIKDDTDTFITDIKSQRDDIKFDNNPEIVTEITENDIGGKKWGLLDNSGSMIFIIFNGNGDNCTVYFEDEGDSGVMDSYYITSEVVISDGKVNITENTNLSEISFSLKDNDIYFSSINPDGFQEYETEIVIVKDFTSNEISDKKYYIGQQNDTSITYDSDNFIEFTDGTNFNSKIAGTTTDGTYTINTDDGIKLIDSEPLMELYKGFETEINGKTVLTVIMNDLENHQLTYTSVSTETGSITY
ncbi:MAG: hypothetical protein ACQESP_10920, partial [Candidatus Muiribacteriota bacterium]